MSSLSCVHHCAARRAPQSPGTLASEPTTSRAAKHPLIARSASGDVEQLDGRAPAVVRRQKGARVQWSPMVEHPDVLLGTTSAGDGSIDVMVSGVDVRLTIRHREHENLVLLLGPDETINLRDMLDQALEV